MQRVNFILQFCILLCIQSVPHRIYAPLSTKSETGGNAFPQIVGGEGVGGDTSVNFELMPRFIITRITWLLSIDSAVSHANGIGIYLSAIVELD